MLRRFSNNRNILLDLGLLCTLLLASAAEAHFMVAQRGTLNFVDDGVFMVLSIPSSAFDLKDSDDNNLISMVEFNNQRSTIAYMVKNRILLSDELGSRELLGMMLSPELSHDTHEEHISQIIVMGKYSIAKQSGELRFHTDLFGADEEERELTISAKRKTHQIEQEFILSDARTTVVLDSELSAAQSIDTGIALQSN